MTTFTPDPKPESRHVADRDEWDRIVLAKAGPCRGCGAPGETFHHLVPKGNHRGDDVAANIVPLCGHGTVGCHGALECHTSGWEEVAHAVRHSLTPLEKQYVVAKKSHAWLDRYYPAGETKLCAKCRRPIKEKPADFEPPRRRRWIKMEVPDDAENGKAIWDELTTACGEALSTALGYDGDTPAYYVHTAVMGLFLQRLTEAKS